MMKTKECVKQIELADILMELPQIVQVDCGRQFSNMEYDTFLCALGFEDRCLTIPEQLAATDGFTCKRAFCFEYSTNPEDNEANRPRLVRAFQMFAGSHSSVRCDDESFARDFRQLLAQDAGAGKILLDISVCSSKLLISIIRILLESDVSLTLVYSEAAVYHPTGEEFRTDPNKWTIEEGFGVARGVGEVIPSPHYAGVGRENPDLIIAFPTFKPERTKAIVTYIDESLAVRPASRIIWIIGDPHMDDKARETRKDMIRTINRISDEVPCYEVSTLDYKKTLEILDQIYRSKSLDFHINISALGSKMQSLGIALFCHMRPDVSVYLAIPKEFNPLQYSERCSATWEIEFRDVSRIRRVLDRVGEFELVKVNTTAET